MAYDSFYAYDTPGWTSQDQNETTPGSLPDPPQGLSRLRITASYTANGKGQSGILNFAPSIKYVTTASGRVSLTPKRVHLRDGKLPEDFSVLQQDLTYETVPEQWDWNVTGRVGRDNINQTIKTPYPSESYDLTTQELIGVRTVPADYNISELYTGDSFDLSITLRDTSLVDGAYVRVPVDLAGCTVTSQIREAPLSPNILTEFRTEIQEPVEDGIVYLLLTSGDTSTLRGLEKVYYDVQVTHADGWVHTYIKGWITVDPDVTKP